MSENKLKSVTLINCSDIKSISNENGVDMKRKYSDFHRPKITFEFRKNEFNEINQYLRDVGKLKKR